MRTTLTLENDALKLARELSRAQRISLGRAVSELVRRGARQPLTTREVNGLHVVELPEDSPAITTEHVRYLAEELP